MIPAVHPRGRNVGRLLGYLFGPGKREEHQDAHLVAAWLDAPPLVELEPPTTGSGRRDLRKLTELLEQPLAVARNPPAEPVWHCSIRAHPTDRILTDKQWEHIAGEVVAAVGLAPHGDVRAVRWVAVRHAPDHIHLVATRVRQDRRTAWTAYDKRKAQAACRDLEERYGLYRVAPPGMGSTRWPGPAELSKAARKSRPRAPMGRPVTPRDELRRRVRAVATIATGEADFFVRLRHAGVRVKLRVSVRNPDEVTGYAVGLEGHTTAPGAIVWYGGGRLAPDLTLPRLRARWTDSVAPEQPAGQSAARLAAAAFPNSARVYQRAADTAARAAEAIRAATSPEEVSAIAKAAADVLAAAAGAWDGPTGRLLSQAAEAFDQAAYERQRVRAPASGRIARAGELRAMARLVALIGVLTDSKAVAEALQLIYALAALAEHVADIRDAQRRIHQAQAARQAARQLRVLAGQPAAGLPDGLGRATSAAPAYWVAPVPPPISRIRPRRSGGRG